MNIFLLGYKGYLGSYFRKHLNVDVVIENKKYDYFINCASKTSLEYCEEHPLQSQASNLDVLSDIHKRIPEAKIISFSSYYVYDDVGLCKETAKTTDKYQYTKHKLLAERFVVENEGVIFRLGKLFGNVEGRQQNRLTEVFIKSNKITLDKVGFNPTSVKQVLGAVTYELKNRNLVDIFNLSNKGVTTHLDYGEYIDKVLNTSTDISIIQRMPRSFENYGRFLMDTTKIERYLDLSPWQHDLGEYLGCIV